MSRWTSAPSSNAAVLEGVPGEGEEGPQIETEGDSMLTITPGPGSHPEVHKSISGMTACELIAEIRARLIQKGFRW